MTDEHPLDWYPRPDDDPAGEPLTVVEAWMQATPLISDPGELKAMALRLESGPWHPSRELATSLVKAAASALEMAERPAELSAIRNGLLAAEELFRRRGSKLIESNLLVAQRVRTEWELGRLILDGRSNGTFREGRPRKTVTSDDSFSLREIGVTRNQSSLFQRVASLDLDDLDHWVDGVINDPNVELSTMMVLDVLWREQAREQRTAARVAVAEAVLPSDVVLAVADARSLPLADDTVDLTFTSPPYGLDITYTGGDVTAGEWRNFMRHWLGEVLRVTKPSGRLAVNVPLDTRRPYPRATYAETVAAARDAGWEYQFTIVWDEGNTSKGNRSLGSVNGSTRPVHVSPAEMIAVFSNGDWGPSCDGRDDILPDDWQSWGREVWRLPGESSPWEGHPAPFPEGLAKRVIQYLSPIGATVLDPFSGSGTTVLVASRHGRTALGFDSSPEYVESAKRRVAR
jgi:site-specific DNA-methyltransferase (adenine-specific)/site-specific DNA-methyltransferase (cytosine-N4-specific)